MNPNNETQENSKLSTTTITKRFAIWIVCLLALNAVSAADAEPEYVAQVGNKMISVAEFQQRSQDMMKTGFRHVEVLDQKANHTFLNGIIAHELLVLDGLNRGLAQDSTIAEEVERTKDQALRAKVYEVEALKGDYSSTEEELKRFFVEQQYDTEVFSQHIVCATEEEAAQVLDRLDKGETFEELVPLFSTPHIQKRFGPAGFVGWVKTGGLLTPLIAPFSGMAPGETYTEPVETNSGFHVFRLKARRPVDFAADHDWVERRLRESKRGRDMEIYVKDLRHQYGLALDASILQRLQQMAPDQLQWPGEDEALFTWRGGQMSAADYMEHHRLGRVRHPSSLDSIALHKAADGLAGREIMMSEALRLKLDRDPDVVVKTEARRDELLIKWIYHLVGKSAARDQGVTEEDIRAFYDANQDLFTRKDGGLADFDLVHDSIRTSLRTTMENHAMDELIAQLRTQYSDSIVIFPEVLAHVELKRPTPRKNAEGGNRSGN
jgi:peptidyl-prolyl cis-trans isomerase C